MSRWVQIDDVDGAVKYGSGWSLISGDQYNSAGNFGQTYLNTLHSTTRATSFTISFNGADGKVWGTTNISKDSAGVIDPSWECLVDGKAIPQKDPFPYTENNWVLCGWDSSLVPMGQHTLTVNVKSNGRPFLFDYFGYNPSPNANIAYTSLRLAYNDKALEYGSGWTKYGSDLGMMAPAAGATLRLNFYGTGVIWYGTAPTELPHASSTAAYAVDGQRAKFTVPGTATTLTHYNEFYFRTPEFPLGHHSLFVRHEGTTSQTPLVLTNVIILGGSLPEPPNPSTVVTPPVLPNTPQPNAGSSTTTLSATASITTTATIVSNGVTITQTQLISPAFSTGSSANPSGAPNVGQVTGSNTPLATGSPSAGSNIGDTNNTVVDGSGSSTPIGAIVGGVLGFLLLLALLVLLIIFLRRRKRRQHKALEKVQVQQPFYSDMVQSQSAVNVAGSGAGGSSLSPETSHFYGTYQTPQAGHVGEGTPSKRRPTELSPSSPGFSHYQISSNATSYSRAPESSVGSEATESSAQGSLVPLVPVRTPSSKHEEHVAESSSQPYGGYYTPAASVSHARVIDHQDSGYRLPHPPAPPTPAETTLEFPPAYTTA